MGAPHVLWRTACRGYYVKGQTEAVGLLLHTTQGSRHTQAHTGTHKRTQAHTGTRARTGTDKCTSTHRHRAAGTQGPAVMTAGRQTYHFLSHDKGSRHIIKLVSMLQIALIQSRPAHLGPSAVERGANVSCMPLPALVGMQKPNVHSALWPCTLLKDAQRTFYSTKHHTEWRTRSLGEFVPMLDRLGLDLLTKMLIYAPHRRITCAAALQHEWFADIPQIMQKVRVCVCVSAPPHHVRGHAAAWLVKGHHTDNAEGVCTCMC
eukprot:1159085-Pelagomonas_calceolata.AAC.5